MKKLLLLFALMLVLVSCGDDKDEPNYKPAPDMNTQFLMGKAFQSKDDSNYYIIFTNDRKYITFHVKENEKSLWLYLELTFEVVKRNDYFGEQLAGTWTYLICTRSDGGQANPMLLSFDPTNLYQDYSYTDLVITSDLGYAGKKEEHFKYAGTSNDILNKFSSYTKD